MVSKPSLIYILVFGFSLIASNVISEDVTKAQEMQVILPGETSVLMCSFHPAVRQVVWSFSGQNISASSQRDGKHYGKIDKVKQISYMKIRNIQFNDAGDYNCLQYFQFGSPRRRVFTLQVQEYPQLKLQKNETTENDTIKASCCVGIAKTADHISIIWFMDREPLPLPNGTLIQKKKKQNYIEACSNVSFYSSRGQNGLPLMCLVWNVRNLSTSVVLKVIYPPSVRMLMTSFVIVINKETGFKVICEADGNPHPTLKLQKKDIKSWSTWSTLTMKPTLLSTTVNNSNSNWIFHFDGVSNSLIGNYRCLADNGYGEAFSTETVEVVEINSKGSIILWILLATMMIGVLLCVMVFKVKHPHVQSVVSSSKNSKDIDDDPEYLTVIDCPHITEGNIRFHAYESSSKNSKDIDEHPEYLTVIDCPHITEGNKSFHAYESPQELSSVREPEGDLDQMKNIPHYHTLERGSKEDKSMTKS